MNQFDEGFGFGSSPPIMGYEFETRGSGAANGVGGFREGSYGDQIEDWAEGLDTLIQESHEMKKKSVALPATVGAYVVVRCKDAACFAGNVVKKEGQEITLTNARRIWFWKGAKSLSELAVHGTVEPALCKFGVPVTVTIVWCEIISTTKKGEKSIKGIPEWK